MIYKFLLIVVMVVATPLYAHDAHFNQVMVNDWLKQFDRELDEAKPGQWNLEDSPAYQNLMALRAGEKNPMSVPRKFEPGTDKNGHLLGGELPRGTWALTYDDGPHPSRTEPILRVLTAENVVATFFWLAQNVTRHKRVVELVQDLGHAVENHSFTHVDLVKASDFALGYEVGVSRQVLTEHLRIPPKYFRCPYGSGDSNARVRRMIASEKMVSVMWNVDSLDWADKDAASVADRVYKQMTKLGRGIILFHDIQTHTALATQKLFTSLRKSSVPIRFVTIPQIVDELNKP